LINEAMETYFPNQDPIGNTTEGAAELLEVPSSSFVWRCHDLGGDGISLLDHGRAAF
jgi:hypothetical protein